MLSLQAFHYRSQTMLILDSLDETFECEHSNGSNWAALSRGAVYYAVEGDPNFLVYGWNPIMWPFRLKLPTRTFL